MNNQARILPLKINILSQYKEVCEETKALEAKKSALKSQIFALMDQNQTDTLSLGDCKAIRSLVVQERIDSAKVREMLGEKVSQVMTEAPVSRLQVI